MVEEENKRNLKLMSNNATYHACCTNGNIELKLKAQITLMDSHKNYFEQR